MILVLLQISKVLRHRLQYPVRLTQTSQFLGHLPGFASLEPLPQLPVETLAFLVRYRHLPQRQADVLRRMPEIQDELPPLTAQAHTLGHPLYALPDPRCPIGQEHHRLRLRCAQAVQVHRQQFHCLVRPTEGAIEPRSAGADLLALRVDLVEDQQLDVAPLRLVTAPLLLGFALAFLLAGDTAQPALACVDATSHALASQFLADGHLAVAVVEQVAFAAGRELGGPGAWDPGGLRWR